jgi:DNA-binding NtrC family response regulator
MAALQSVELGSGSLFGNLHLLSAFLPYFTLETATIWSAQVEEKLGHVLILEDEYLIAFDLAEAFEKYGAMIVGPFASLASARAAIENTPELDGAVIDINLRGELSFPIAEMLRERHVPFIFTSGYDQLAIPSSLCQVPLVAKPADAGEVAGLLANLIGKGRPTLQ